MAFGYRGDARWLRPHPLGGWGDGRTYGCAVIPGLLGGESDLACVFSDGEEPISEGWEHVSVSAKNRTPTWTEMVRIKRLFWDDEDCVVEFHPPRSEYVDRCRFCLHLWRHREIAFPRPPKGLV